MSDSLASLLSAATGATCPLRVEITAPGASSATQEVFEYPYAVVGRGEGCDILLQHPLVSFRHAYLQTIEGRIFCVDLASRTGIHWPDGPRKYGWVPSQIPIRIGPYVLRVIDGERPNSPSHPEPANVNPLERYRGEAGPMPAIDLELREEENQPAWSVNRLLTLVGRSPLCKVRIDSPAVSAVHCGLLLTRQSLWVIDLLGRGGTQVNDRLVRTVPLERGARIRIGDHQIGVAYSDGADIVVPDRLTDHLADSETSMDDIESPFLRDSDPPGTAVAPPDLNVSTKDELEWHGSVFSIEAHGDTLVVLPVVEGSGFRYQQLHIEANLLQRKLDSKLFKNLVVDLRNLSYFGSELIGVLIRLARSVTNAKGRAALCSPTPRMLEVLEAMRLAKLWPIFPERAAALKYVRE
jgi:anti-anti-sigma factor